MGLALLLGLLLSRAGNSARSAGRRTGRAPGSGRAGERGVSPVALPAGGERGPRRRPEGQLRAAEAAPGSRAGAPRCWRHPPVPGAGPALGAARARGSRPPTPAGAPPPPPPGEEPAFRAREGVLLLLRAERRVAGVVVTRAEGRAGEGERVSWRQGWRRRRGRLLLLSLAAERGRCRELMPQRGTKGTKRAPALAGPALTDPCCTSLVLTLPRAFFGTYPPGVPPLKCFGLIVA